MYEIQYAIIMKATKMFLKIVFFSQKLNELTLMKNWLYE